MGNAAVSVYDVRALIPFDGHTNVTEVAQAVDLLCDLEPNRSTRVCDVGCGCGWHLRELHSRGYRCLYGIDLSANSLLVASRVCKNTSAILVHQDISATRQPNFFDVVTVFNATLGAGSRASDLAFVRGISAQLHAGGKLLLTYFPSELAFKHVGNFSVSYDEGSASVVDSVVEFKPRKGELCIRQRIGDTTLPTERLRLYSRSAMKSLLANAGFVTSQPSSRLESQLESFGIDWIVGTKPNE